MEEKKYQLKNKERQDHRLKKNRQFSYIFRKGERFSTRNFNLFIIDSKYKNYKIGYSISKKEGKANKRNLLKRRMKEIVRINRLPSNNHNYILQAKNSATELDYKEIENQLIKVFEKAKLK